MKKTILAVLISVTLFAQLAYSNSLPWQKVAFIEVSTVTTLTTADRDALIPEPEQGMLIFNLNSQRLEVWNGRWWSTIISR